jgi:hypothetical protein
MTPSKSAPKIGAPLPPADLGPSRQIVTPEHLPKDHDHATHLEKVTHSAPISMSTALAMVVSARQKILLFSRPDWF